MFDIKITNRRWKLNAWSKMVFRLFSAARRTSPAAIRCVRYIYTVRGTTPQTLRAQGPARTRFAPSPTGYLHLGSLRTALFNYLVAKATGGQFLLRLEDTDQVCLRILNHAISLIRTEKNGSRCRSKVVWGFRMGGNWIWWGFVEFGWFCTSLTFPQGQPREVHMAHINRSETYTCLNATHNLITDQSERTELYKEHTEKLLESGNAYRCFCTSERLHTLAEHKNKLGLPPDYDRTCAHIPKEESDDRASTGESHVVRLKVPDKYPVFDDLVYGIVRQRKAPQGENLKQTSFDDPILLKSDGFPTYHLANVVDDHLMKITHVIRGTVSFHYTQPNLKSDAHTKV